MPEPPTFDFTWSQECNLTVRFVGVGIDPDGSIVNHTWDFGDGPTITDSGAPGAMLHQFPAEGTYTVTLSGCDNDGLCTSVSKEVRVVFEPCENCTLRLYGTFDMGAGDLGFKDPETGLKPENPPYTDPVAPFYPQSGQAPKKDFITFNPAIMDHNQGYPELSFRQCESFVQDGNDVQQPKEKVFKRMWYEKLWFKDEDKDGCWDIVMVRDSYTKKVEVCGPEDFEDVHEMFTLGYTIKEHNNDPALGDIYGPAIVQEFTYMFLDTNTMPIMIQDGSRVLIPMASWTAGDGIDSFDADGDNKRDALYVESERTVGIDIDQDGRRKESMDRDRKELSGDETLVLVLKNKLLGQGAKVQMFDHVVELVEVLGDQAIFNVYDNEGGGTQRSTMNVAIGVGEYKRFYRALEDTSGTTFYLKLIATDSEKTKAIVEMGRMFGQAGANIGANIDWNQKAFMVDGVLYEIAGIKAKDNCVKYIVIREKLPKDEIKLYGKHLEVWEPNTVLPEMPPFNEEHEIFVDVQPTWTKPESQQDKIGEKVARPPLEIKYVKEDVEERYKGELKEIYDEMKIRECSNPHPTNDEWCKEKERWLIEWFYTYPDQYTEFVLPRGELYLVTLSWYAPEASYHIWDGEEEDDGPIAPIAHGFVNRVKFWYDPSDPTDIYVNRIEGGNSTPSNPYNPHEPYNPYDANKNYEIEMDELLNAVADWNKGDLSMSGLMELVNYWYAGQKYCVYCI
ncbi:PKD domain-containing protein [Archaeoglobus sulfaticallidus]|nr:PKD domain-containing protein [Archaeoglobus sulfaticallidus]